jgi:hypothetical protein
MYAAHTVSSDACLGGLCMHVCLNLSLLLAAHPSCPGMPVPINPSCCRQVDSGLELRSRCHCPPLRNPRGAMHCGTTLCSPGLGRGSCHPHCSSACPPLLPAAPNVPSPSHFQRRAAPAGTSAGNARLRCPPGPTVGPGLRGAWGVKSPGALPSRSSLRFSLATSLCFFLAMRAMLSENALLPCCMLTSRPASTCVCTVPATQHCWKHTHTCRPGTLCCTLPLDKPRAVCRLLSSFSYWPFHQCRLLPVLRRCSTGGDNSARTQKP